MIVNRADTFGLAQLYQLRGRVGRSKERAYAYLLVPARRAVTKDAQRRLEVLQAFTELGAGFTHRLARPRDPRRRQPARRRTSRAPSRRSASTSTPSCWRRRWREMRGEPPRAEIEPEVTLPLPGAASRTTTCRTCTSGWCSTSASPSRGPRTSSGPARRARGPLRRGARRGGPPARADALENRHARPAAARAGDRRGRSVVTLGTEAALDGRSSPRWSSAVAGCTALTPDTEPWRRRMPRVGTPSRMRRRRSATSLHARFAHRARRPPSVLGSVAEGAP